MLINITTIYLYESRGRHKTYQIFPFKLKTKHMWQANITIQNNTDYNLTVDGVGPGNTTIGANSETQWSSQGVHNSKSLLFWVTPNVWYMNFL